MSTPTVSGTGVLETEVWSIVEDVWSSLLGTSPAPGEAAVDVTDSLGAVVTLHGDWDGSVALACPRTTAEQVARVMLDLSDDEELTPEDVEDALGEVVNVLGGNVKSLLLEGCTLGLPHILHHEPEVDGVLVSRLDIAWADHVARLSIWRTDPATAAAAAHDTAQETA